MITTHRPSELVQTADPTSQVSAYFKQCWHTYQEWRRRQRLRATLYGLQDRDLKDIGISRSEIEYLSLNGTDWRTDPRGHL